jgi:peptidyl-prolyl cis-trans isomerase SurA
MFRIKVLVLLMAAAVTPALAQVQVADKIIGQIGNKIILQSDLNEMFNQEKQANPNLPDSARCYMFYTLLSQQILIEQAGRDSVIVSDEEVENILDNRVRSMMQQYGSKEAFEEANGGRTIYQLKDEYRSFFKDRTVAEKMQGQIMEKVKVTPQEIEKFYTSLPQDSLPPYPATVEMGQIVIKPKVDPEVEQLAKEKLEGIRKEIVENGKSFATMAGIYGMDGTKDNGGELDINRKDFDAQFVSAAYRLQPGEISPVVKTKFGYHIIQMVRRMGDEAKVRHIVIVPEITNADLQTGLKKLDSVRADLVSGKITFAEAVGKYSTDEQSKMTGGMVYDQSGNSVLAVGDLDREMAQAVGELKVGEYSQPQIFVENPNAGSARATRILYMKNRTDPHVLNLKDDYAKIQQGALSKKQSEYLNKWVAERVSSYYVRIDPEYQGCSELKGWSNVASSGTK